MTENQESTVEEQPQQPVTLGRPTKYDWETWTNGERHVIAQGTDFCIEARSMQASLHVKAGKLGLKVVTRILDEGTKIAFRYVPADATASV